MQILAELELQDTEEEELCSILGCSPSELPQTLAAHASAALEEYVRLYLGQEVFTQKSQADQYRLYLLTKHVYDEQMPSEDIVRSLFQTDQNRTRSLMRDVLAKYQYRLRNGVRRSIAQLLSQVQWLADSNAYIVSINNKSIVGEINGTLTQIDGTLPPIRLRPGTSANYLIPQSSYNKLCEYYDVDTVENLPSD